MTDHPVSRAWFVSHALEDESRSVSAPLSPSEQEQPSTNDAHARYEMVSVIGEGGMGRVWLGWDHVIRRNVAIKEPLGSDGSIEAVKLQREVTLTAQLNHPGIAAIHDVFDQDGKPMFVMALVRGQTLAQAIKTPHMSTSRLIRAVLEACQIMGHAHRKGVIHRDLTPSNILLEDNDSVRVIDWGMALQVEEAKQGPAPAGTLGYMSPEQERGEALDARVDVWSLGTLLYEVIHGHLPPPSSTRLSNQDPLTAIWSRARQSNPDNRYDDAKDMADDLLRWFDGNRVHAHDMSMWQLGLWLTQKHRKKIALFMLVLLCLLAVGALGIWRTRQESRRARLAERESLQQARRAQAASEAAHKEATAAKRQADEVRLESGHQALHAGDIEGARNVLREVDSLNTHPKGVGLRMRLGMIPEIQRESTASLPPCDGRRLLTDDPNLLLCTSSSTIVEGWRAKHMIWRVDMRDHFRKGSQNFRIKSMRVGREKLVIHPNLDGVFSVDLSTGQVTRSPQKPRRFSSERDTSQVPLTRRPCQSVMRAYVDDHATTFLCRNGQVWSDWPKGPRKQLYGGASGLVHHYAYVAPTREHWFATATGDLWPHGQRERRVKLDATIYEVRPIGRTQALLVGDWNGRWHILDTQRGDWLASFTQDVQTVRPTQDARLQVLRKDALEVWTLPKQSLQRVYQGLLGWSYAFTDVAWSLDGTTLGLADGNGQMHVVTPSATAQPKPAPYFGSVTKSITPYGARGFMALTSYHDPDPSKRSVVHVEQKRDALETKALIPLSAWNAQGSRIEWLEPESLLLVSVGRNLVRLTPDSSGGWHAVRQVEHAVIDVSVDATRTKALALGPKVMSVIQAGQKDKQRAAPQGAYLSAINTNGDLAVTTRQETFIYTEDRSEPMRLPTPGVKSVAWHPELPLVATGARDGSITIWHAHMVEPVAYIKHHDGWVVSLAFSPNGRFLASASWDSTVRILDARPLRDVRKQAPEL